MYDKNVIFKIVLGFWILITPRWWYFSANWPIEINLGTWKLIHNGNMVQSNEVLGGISSPGSSDWFKLKYGMLYSKVNLK